MDFKKGLPFMITVIIPTYNHPSYISYLVKNSIDTYEGSLFRFQIHDSSEDNKTEEIVSKSKIYIKYFHYSKTFNADDKIISALKQVNSTYAYIMGDGCLPDFNKLENDLLKNSFSKYDLIGLVEAKNFNTKQKAIPYLKKSVFYENFELNYFASKFLYLLTYYGATIVSSAIIKFIIEQKLFEKFSYKHRHCYAYIFSVFESLAGNKSFCFSVCAVDYLKKNPLKKAPTRIGKNSFFDIILAEFKHDVDLLPLYFDGSKKDIIKTQRTIAFKKRDILFYRANKSFNLFKIFQYRKDLFFCHHNLFFMVLACFLPPFVIKYFTKLYKTLRH